VGGTESNLAAIGHLMPLAFLTNNHASMLPIRLAPTRLDVWLSTALGSLLNRAPVFDLGVQSAIRHQVLGGFWFAAVLYIYWVKAARDEDKETQFRILTTLCGSVLAILLALAAESVVSWPPPMRNPMLKSVFPPYFDISPSVNCFPSLSTTLYGSVAAGIYPVSKRVGTLLWIAVVFAVALPRMYVGGHYLSDVLVGAALALVGYSSARLLLCKWLRPRAESLVAGKGLGRLAWEVLMFVWILQVAIEFRDAIWVKRAIQFFLD